MWKCTKCSKRIDDDFQVCWNCGTSVDGTEDPEFRKADDVGPGAGEDSDVENETGIREGYPAGSRRHAEKAVHCLRCEQAMGFAGTKSFHEGFQWGGLLGDLGQFLVNQFSFDIYVCQRCGRAEFFVSGVGEEFRTNLPAE